MTKRAVYEPKLTRPFYTKEEFELDWAPGVSVSQKMKNSKALQEAWKQKHPNQKILEVSTKSDQELGQSLSPFNLTKRLNSLRKDFPVENVYHAAKVFRHGGPYVDLLGLAPAKAKADPRLTDSGEVVNYTLEKESFPATPAFLFYVWLYIKALQENPGLISRMKDIDAFCDIESNPTQSTVNQAMACAIFLSLSKLNLLKEMKDFDSFKKIMMADSEANLSSIQEQSGKKEGPLSMEEMRAGIKRQSFPVGTKIMHPTIGQGEVIRKTPTNYIIYFRISGPKTLTKEFVETQCKKVA